MGLDIVEFVMAVEGSFGVEIPDEDAVSLETPHLLVDYLSQRLPATTRADPTCLTQRAFYRARAATARRFQIDRRSLRPQSVLFDIMGPRKGEWKALRADTGCTQWPRLKSTNWLFPNMDGVTTLGELARHLTVYDVAALREPNAPWTRKEIEALVVDLVKTELGVDMSKYSLDSMFVRDMGLD